MTEPYGVPRQPVTDIDTFIPMPRAEDVWKRQLFRPESHVRSVGYHFEKRILEVEFRTGHTYHYYEVPWEVPLMLCKARSPGGFIHAYVRPKFAVKPIQPHEELFERPPDPAPTW